MMLEADHSLASGYASRTQQARRITEDWVARNGYCLRCDSDRLRQTIANTKTCDFICEKCDHNYELKSKFGTFSSRVLDGSYGAMLKTVRESRTPTFLLLEYSHPWSIDRLRAVHHSLITENAIQPRKPLAVTAKRAGWIGCNIVLSAIALQGQIPLLERGLMGSKLNARNAFTRLERLSLLSAEKRTWAAAILQLTERFPTRFSLQDMYDSDKELQLLFPNNKNIRPKIRQQLQVLRDAGLITFRGGGEYERRNHI